MPEVQTVIPEQLTADGRKSTPMTISRPALRLYQGLTAGLEYTAKNVLTDLQETRDLRVLPSLRLIYRFFLKN